MANGIQVIPTLDRFAGLGQGASNLVAGLIQQQQQRSLAGQLGILGQQIQGGGQIDLSALSDPRAQQLALNFLGQRQQQQRPVAVPQGGNLVNPITGETVAQGQVPTVSATQQIAQLKLDTANRIQAIPEAERTAGQKETLKRIIEGQSAVQVNFPQPAAAAERTAIAETNASLDSLANLETLFNKSTTTTGPVSGRLETAKGFFGLSSEDQENFLAATSAFKNKVIKDITGAQMSEQEASRIMKQIPLETDPPARWRAKKKQTELNLKAIQKRRIQVLEQSGLVAPGSSPIQSAPSEQEQLRLLDEQIRLLEQQQNVDPQIRIPQLDTLQTGGQRF